MIRYPLLLLLVSGPMAVAQLSHPVMASRDDLFSGPRSYLSQPDTLRVLAVMVQFQEDNDTRTSGNGRFDLSAPTSPIIDAPPRDRQHFQDHLTFLQNYYRKASKGKQLISTTVLDQVVTLPAAMATYSPPRNGPNTAVGNLASDAWRRVDSLGLVPDFSGYDCFLLFHAGVGRDIDLVAILGYDPTPFDIPSLYLNLSAFRSFYGEDYPGIPVQGGSFHITNTIVMPETESRLLPGLDGDVLLELGLNGLLCASVANHLGLPDLFDTRTGRSAIGRFGLMDGQAIFSFAGVFPPEPSAWEKYWLGWVRPVDLGAGEHTVTLPAMGVADTVYRVPISAQEYYLVENRNRDPQGNGQTVWSVFNGVPATFSVPRDTSGFNAFDISALSGVVTEVEDLDWSLPGGVSSEGVFFDGGTLIWHVDESVIVSGLPTNSVNADPARRGVDVEEADGSQDIGEEYGFLTPGSGSEEGTPLDFWYEGNSSPVYRNEFSATTYPATVSNAGASGHVSVRAFSTRGARMTATIVVGDDAASLLPGFPKRVGERLPFPSLTVTDLDGDNLLDLLLATSGLALPPPALQGNPDLPFPGFSKIYAWESDGTPSLADGYQSGLAALSGSPSSAFFGAPAAEDVDGDGVIEFTIGQNGGFLPAQILTYQAVDRNADSLFDAVATLPGGPEITSAPVIADSLVSIGGGEGSLYVYTVAQDPPRSLRVANDSSAFVRGVSRFTGRDVFLAAGSDGTLALTNEGATGRAASIALAASFPAPPVAGIVGPGTDPRIAVAAADGAVFLFDSALRPVPGFPVFTGDSVRTGLALADVDGDGMRDIVVFSRNRVHVYNHAGASLDNFPVTVPSNESITSHPIVADLNGDGAVEVVAVTADGLVSAYDKNGRMPAGFPLQAGTGMQSVAVFPRPAPPLSVDDIVLAVASSETGSITAWRTGSTVNSLDPSRVRPWGQYQKDARHSGLTLEALSGTPVANEFFPPGRAYNWPNPVYEGNTFIRYFVSENATVSIRVFDLSGDLVTEFPGPGIGGVDNEVAWDVSGVQSGVYFARIEASGAGGSGVAVVKVAVVK